MPKEACYQEIEERIARMREENARLQKTLSDACDLTDYRSLVRQENGLAIWTDALQAALREHEIVRITPSEQIYYLDGTVTIPSNRRIEAQGANIALAPEVTVLMLRNEHTPDGTLQPVCGPRDKNIAVIGGHWEDWRRRRTGYGGSGRYDATVRELGKYLGISTLFYFANCDEVTVSDVTFAHTSAFAVQAGDGFGHIYEKIRFEDCYADGIHLNGNLTCVHVRDVCGTVGDDLVALNAYDWLNSSCNFGPQRFFLCEDMELCLQDGQGYPAIRIQPAKYRYADGSIVDCAISDVIFRRVKGIVTYKMYLQTPRYLIGTPHEWAEVGTGGNLFFEDLDIDLTHPIDNMFQYHDSDPLRGHFAAFEFGADLDSVTLRDIRIHFHLEDFPFSHLATVGPKSIVYPDPKGKGTYEVFDPYVSCHLAKLTLENIQALGREPDELVHLTSFQDINHDGNSTGCGTVGCLNRKCVTVLKR